MTKAVWKYQAAFLVLDFTKQLILMNKLLLLILLISTTSSFCQKPKTLYKTTNGNPMPLFYVEEPTQSFDYPKMIVTNISKSDSIESIREKESFYLEKTGVKKFNILRDKTNIGTIDFSMDNQSGKILVKNGKKNETINFVEFQSDEYINYLSMNKIKKSLIGKVAKGWKFVSLEEFTDCKVLDSKALGNTLIVKMYFGLKDIYKPRNRYNMIIEISYNVSDDFYYQDHSTISFN